MCGILLVQSRSPVNESLHQKALDLLQTRGPDMIRTWKKDNTFVAHSVLRITGDDSFYQQPSEDFLAYNGEIYNYKSFGKWSSDIDLVNHAVTHNRELFRSFCGPWAWIYATGDQVWYASDPQGERFLYRYQDPDITIVCSEIAPILCYVSPKQVDVPYVNKCWTMWDQMPWQGIHRLEPGRLYGSDSAILDSIWNWIHPLDVSERDAYDEFDHLWKRVISEMTPDCKHSVCYSGGIDSGLISKQLLEANLVTVNMLGKDPIVDQLDKLLDDGQKQRLTLVPVTPEQYATDYQSLIRRTRMPAQSWSFGGRWAAVKNTTTRVLFTGAAADELFGGYDQYLTLQYDHKKCNSVYSHNDHANLWLHCLEAYESDPRPATLLMDYWYQVVGCDSPGQDRIAGSWGIETRNPFQHKDIMQFALNLPWKLRVGHKTKPLLRRMFKNNWPDMPEFPKQGFAGHANDSLPWLGVDIQTTGNRQQDWCRIAQDTFYAYTKD